MLSDDGSGSDGKKGKLMALRVPANLEKYVRDRAGGRRGGITEVLEDALKIHQHLFERLGSHRIRIQRYALDESLDWPSKEPEVYSKLILRGLDDSERGRRRK